MESLSKEFVGFKNINDLSSPKSERTLKDEEVDKIK